MQISKLKTILEAILLAADRALTVIQLETLFELDEERPTRDEIRQALHEMADDYSSRGYELKQVASGFRLQVKQEYAIWVGRLWEEKPARYTRALLETMALIAYRQPITRGEIEEVRGVSVSSNIVKTLLERNWIKVLGHKDVPGKPTLYGTTKTFLDYFNLKSLDQLPTLAEIKDLDSIHPELELDEDAAENATDHAEQGNVELENNISNDTESSADNVNSILNENDTVEESPGEDITEQQASEESVTDLDPSTSPDDVEPQEKIENQDADKKQVINV
jgi:segregation and condensation protein B